MVSSPLPLAQNSRQRPGSACEECRRRKVRCDRQRPQCQVCYESGLECKISTARLPRGPRKGQLRTLRTRIGRLLLSKSSKTLAERVAALERCLADQHPEFNQQMNALLESPDFELDSDDETVHMNNYREGTESPEGRRAGTKSPRSPGSPRSGIVSELMRADLDQLYFDRVHTFAPILQRWRYHVWSKQQKKSEAQTCLQYAMWTIAAALSAQFRSLRDPLYQETRRMLDALDSQGGRTDATAGIEQAQAWVLICIYEYMQLSPLQAWMSAGRCSRLVLGMRLYELDDPNNTVVMARDQETSLIDWTGLEERRRTFWMAYSLDRFISFHNGLPFTLNEQLIVTRLPGPEEEFQAGQPVATQYLPEVMMKTSTDAAQPISSFSECIVLATICGRALAHRQKVAAEQVNMSGDMTVFEGFWTRHQWLHEMVNHHIQMLSASAQVDPMLMFARIVAQTMVLFLHSVLESITWKTGDHLLGIIEYERLCVSAAHEVVNLVKLQGQLGYFKVHPLTPIPLTMCSDFIAGHTYLDAGFDGMLQEVMACLQDLDRVKNATHSPRESMPAGPLLFLASTRMAMEPSAHIPCPPLPPSPEESTDGPRTDPNDETSPPPPAVSTPTKGKTILLFGCQWLSFTAADFHQLRATILDDPQFHWMLDILGELPAYYRTAAADAYLPCLQTIDGEEELVQLERWFRCGELTGVEFPLCYTRLAPLLVMTHFVQYVQCQTLRRLGGTGSDWVGTVVDSGPVVEIVGFCIGFLSAVVVSAAKTAEGLRTFGAVALRLGMLLGALGDVQEAEEAYTSLATMWRSPLLEDRLEGVLTTFPGSHITVRYDENRATITAPRHSIAALQQALQSVGFSASPVAFNGRYHWAGHEKRLPALFALCNANPGLRLPDVVDLPQPQRANTTPELVASGPLHELVLRAVLARPCLWHQTFSAVYQDHLTHPDSIVVEFGPERCIPPSFFRRLPLRVIHFADLALPYTISRDHELSTRPPSDTDIAIVGMACRVAGADDLDEFWDLLCVGKSQHTEMPQERYANYEAPWRPEASRQSWFGNFIRDIDAFDHKFFKKSPREVMAQDPQQRLILQVAYQALESAGYFSRPSKNKDVGCYIASCTVDYEHNVNCYPASAYAATGLLRSFLAGKLSHYFGWRGPSLCVDTACSGSAVALHHACRAILNGDCSAALVGGANAITSPLAYDNLAGAAFLSPTGGCKPFDAKADGYCRGEGFAAIYVKRLSYAIAAGDTVLATIAGTAVEQNDNCTPIVVPDAASLARLFNKVTTRASLHPRDISVVEAHGTGTQAGDPAEYSSVRDVFGGPRRAGKLALGSVKGLVGHTEGVSGMIALCKLVLMIQGGRIPPQPGFTSLNPHINKLPDDHVDIATSGRAWDAGFRAALINNYGACGSNASVIITQGPQHKQDFTGIHADGVVLPFLICALDKGRLQAQASRLRGFLSRRHGKEISLANVAFNTARQSNPGLDCQCIFRAKSLPELNSALSDIANGDEKSLVVVQKPLRPVILCFGGQRGRSVGLDRGLHDALPLFRHHLNACDTILRETGQKSIYPGIFSTSPISDAVQLQTQLFAIQYACARSWVESGVTVAAVIGQSFGELTALCVSGVLSLPDALTVIVRRAIIIRDRWCPDLGAMLAVEGNRHQLDQYLYGSKASIACFNGPRSFTVSGSIMAIDMIERKLENNSTFRVKRLDVTNAFHSSLVDPLVPILQTVTKGVVMNSPTIQIERATAKASQGLPPPSVIADHLRQPVYFSDAVQRLAEDHGSAVWLEAGSNSTITSIIRKSLSPDAGHTFHSLNITGSANLALQNLTDTTIGLWKDHIPCSFWGHHALQTTEYSPLFLPPYPFEKTRHWLENKPLPTMNSETARITAERKDVPLFSFDGYEDLLHQVSKYRIHTNHPSYVDAVSGHVAAKTAPIAPASLLLDYAVELLRSLPEGKGKIPSVYDVGSEAPLLLDSNRAVWIEISTDPNTRDTWNLRFRSQDSQAVSGARLLHCTARICMHNVGDERLRAEFTRYGRLISHARCLELLADPDVDDILQGRNVYRSFAEIVEYSERYRGVQKLVGKGSESAGRVVKAYSGETWADAFLCDSFSQCGGFWVNCMTDRGEDEIYIASGIEQWMRTPLYADMAMRRPDTWHVLARHQRDEGWYTSDVFVFSPDGELVEMFLGLRYTRVAKALFVRSLGGSVSQRQDTKEQNPKIESSKKNLVGRVKAVVAEFCAVHENEVNEESNLADAGVDSLMAMELARELESVFRCTLAVEDLLEADTFKELVTIVQDAVGDSDDASISGASDPTSSTLEESVGYLTSITKSVASISDTVDLDLPHGDVLRAFGETKALTDQFLAENQCSGRLHEFTPLLVRLCVVLTLEAFEILGSDIRSASTDHRLSTIEFEQQHHSLVKYLYGRLAEAGLVRLDGMAVIRTETCAPTETSKFLMQRIETEYPEYASASKLTFYTGSKLASVLRGDQDGLQLIFGTEEGQKLVSWMYGEEPHNVVGYKLMGEFIKRLVQRLAPSTKDGGPLRILEMGAGTGGGTKWLLPLLAALPVAVEYTFSDISPAFLAQARRKFREYPFIRYCVHDIEKPPAEELQGTQHIIIASNAVHATSNLQESTRCMRQTLRADGVMMMLEMTKPVFAIDLVFGLFRGWWVFNDGRTHAITNERRWKEDLHAVGYGHVDWTDGESNEVSVQRVIFATAGGQSAECSLGFPNHRARLEVVDEYVRQGIAGFTAPSPSHGSVLAEGACVLVTGGTGSLGSHVVAYLARVPTVQTVVCLNRVGRKNPQQRQEDALNERQLHLSVTEHAKLVVLESDTAQHHLGLSSDNYTLLQTHVTHIIHNAWPMNGVKQLSSFSRQFDVMRNLISLARGIAEIQPEPVRFQFVSSIGTVNGGGALEERTQVEKVTANGYNEAKFVCERMLEETLQRYPGRFQAMIVRPGQIVGSGTACWNTSEHFPAIVKSSQTLGFFPAFTGRMGWTPVDAVASVNAELLLDESTSEEIYHVDNPVNQEWASVVDVLAEELGATKLPFNDWIQRVRQHDNKENPAKVMIDWLEDNFKQMSCQGPLDTTVARRHSRTLREMEKDGEVDEGKVRGFVQRWKEQSFLSPTHRDTTSQRS
ncbi:hypothetical protein BJX99DRAFT_255424 [Aspergillus californicus]